MERMSQDGGMTKAGAIFTAATFGASALGLVAYEHASSHHNTDNTHEVHDLKGDQLVGAHYTLPTGVPGTVEDGSDAAIGADVLSGLTNCGGEKGELWNDKPFTADHLFDYMNGNPDMVKGTKDFWTSAMGEDAFSFAVDKAMVNNDTDKTKKVNGDDQMTAFLQKQVANRDVPEGTIEANHNCIDTNGDGKPDTIKFLDVRVAHHSDNQTEEAAKRTTLNGLLLTEADFNTWVEKVKAAGFDPDLFISYPLQLDLDKDGKISDTEHFHFIAIDSAVCGNPALKMPPMEFQVTTPTGEIVTVTSQPGQTPTTGHPNTTGPNTTGPNTTETTTTIMPPSTTTQPYVPPKVDPGPTPGPNASTTTQPAPAGDPTPDSGQPNPVGGETTTTAPPAPVEGPPATEPQGGPATTAPQGECGDACA